LISICIEQLLIDSQIEQIKNDCALCPMIFPVKYIQNETLKAKYEQAKQKLISAGIKFEEKLMYHGTSPAAIESILLNNFDLKYAKSWPPGRINLYIIVVVSILLYLHSS
jgi:hypothetical protein